MIDTSRMTAKEVSAFSIPATKFCWPLKHKWSLWNVTHSESFGIYHLLRQERRCLDCGLIQLKVKVK